MLEAAIQLEIFRGLTTDNFWYVYDLVTFHMQLLQIKKQHVQRQHRES